jgi:hypothetical protein
MGRKKPKPKRSKPMDKRFIASVSKALSRANYAQLANCRAHTIPSKKDKARDPRRQRKNWRGDY